jgi:uncharacterized membrane protein (DUF441 family)
MWIVSKRVLKWSFCPNALEHISHIKSLILSCTVLMQILRVLFVDNVFNSLNNDYLQH